MGVVSEKNCWTSESAEILKSAGVDFWKQKKEGVDMRRITKLFDNSPLFRSIRITLITMGMVTAENESPEHKSRVAYEKHTSVLITPARIQCVYIVKLYLAVRSGISCNK
ncbi:hypothetical protein J6590_070205 [Homalodisca vitripennis]|nr:hypothetical protein J6590_070205 [Homalodisca vitripennis]